jgi:NDP-sugar pyrophosphorylase family protein
MTAFIPAAFFDVDGFFLPELFDPEAPAWSALGRHLKGVLDARTDWEHASDIGPGVHLLGDRIAIGRGVRIEPGAVLVGPAIIGDGALIRTGAYVREYVVLAPGALVGAHSEVKGSILLDGAKAPHQAYVGDSILGRNVNLGAGTICSNVKNIGREVTFRHQGDVIATGLRKFGAILGDECKTGCNTVLNPGVLCGPGCVTYPNATLAAGYYPPETLVKVRQQQHTVELTRLRRR